MVVNVLIIACIVMLLMLRKIISDNDIILNILDNHTKSIKLIRNTSLHHTDIIDYLVSSAKISIEFVWLYGTDEDRDKVEKLVDKSNKLWSNDGHDEGDNKSS